MLLGGWGYIYIDGSITRQAPPLDPSTIQHININIPTQHTTHNTRFLQSNILAARSVSQILRTSFGPKGMDKMMVRTYMIYVWGVCVWMGCVGGSPIGGG
jgi:hypothetical protein